MKEKLARVLGVSSQNLTDDDLLEKVRQMRFELDAKMGYASASLIEKLKRDGIFLHNEMTQSWSCRLSQREMDDLLKDTK